MKPMKLTWDSNCIIDLEEGRSADFFLRKLLCYHSDGSVIVRIAASSASEKQPNGTYLDDFKSFENRIDSLGIGHIQILKPVFTFGSSFLGYSVFGGNESTELMRKLHTILFPNCSFEPPNNNPEDESFESKEMKQ